MEAILDAHVQSLNSQAQFGKTFARVGPVVPPECRRRHVRVKLPPPDKIVLHGGLLHPRRPPDHLRLLPGPDARGAGLPVRHREPHFTLRHLYVGTSRATSSELLSVL